MPSTDTGYLNELITYTQRGEVLLPFHISTGEAYKGNHNGKSVSYVDLRSIPPDELKQLKYYFFDKKIFLLRDFNQQGRIFHTHLAGPELKIEEIKKLKDEYPALNRHILHLCFIAGHAFHSDLAQKSRMEKLPENQEAPKRSDIQWQYGQELAEIKKLFRLLQTKHEKFVDIPAYKLIRANFSFEEIGNDKNIQKFKFEPIVLQNLLQSLLDILLLELEKNGTEGDSIENAIDNYFYPIFERELPPRNRPGKKHQFFCQQFITYIDEQTPFSTKKGYSRNQLLNLFIKIYELCGYTVDAAYEGGKIGMVRKWYKPSTLR